MSSQTKNALLSLSYLADYFENDKEKLAIILEMIERIIDFKD